MIEFKAASNSQLTKLYGMQLLISSSLISIMMFVNTTVISHAQSISGQQVQTLKTARQALDNITVQRGECVTIINDPDPPTNVRSKPMIESSSIVSRLKPFTFINVINNRNGWLEINHPTKGWVSLNLTLASCGYNDNTASGKRFDKLFEKALAGDINAFDLLVRYTYQAADGVWADIAYSEYLPKLSEKQPDLFITTLNNQTENGRKQLLKALFFNGTDIPEVERQFREKFEAGLSRHKGSPTAQTWQSLVLL
jgi:hypothetical protein